MPTVQRHYGWLRDVIATDLGAHLVTAAAIGDTVLYLDDVVDFEETGGTLYVVGAQLGYASTDPDADTIQLNGPLVDPIDVDEFVAVWDLDNAKPAAELTAQVELLNATADDDPLPATLSHSLSPLLEPKPYDDRGEVVVVERVGGGGWTVVDVLGKETVLDISTANPKKPATPTGLTLSSSVYTVAGRINAKIIADWDDVTTRVDGSTLLNLDHYEVQTKLGAPTSTDSWAPAGTTPAGTSTVTMSPFAVGQQRSVRVAAVDALGVRSDWSTPVSITTSADSTPPAQPSTPVATTRLGTIRIQWDGKNASGLPMDADLAYLEVHLSTVSGFTPTAGDATTMISRLTGAGYTVFGPATYGVSYYVKFIAVDLSGNASSPSAQATAVVAPLVDVSNFPDDAMDTLYARTGHFLQLDADNFAANKIQADWCDVGLMTAMIVRGDQIETDSRGTYGIKLKNTGFTAYNGSTSTFNIDAATGAVTMKGSLTSGSSITGASIDSTSTITGAVVQTTSTPSAGIKLDSSGLRAWSSGVRKFLLDTTGNVVLDGQLTANGLSTFNNGLFINGGSLLVNNYGIAADGSISAAGGLVATAGGLTVTGNSTFYNFVSLSAGITATGAGHFNTVYADSVPTTAASPNAVMGSSGQLLQNSSSRRWKTSIEELPCDPAVALELIPRRFKSTLDDDNPDQWMVGYIAEEAHDLGLTLWVDYEADGTTPRGFNYATWTVALQAIVRHLATDLSDARDRIAALEAA